MTASSPVEHAEDWGCLWKASPEAEKVKREVDGMAQEVHSTLVASTEDYEYAASSWTQLLVVSYRMFQDYWREPNYLYSKLALCIGSVWLLITSLAESD